MEYQMVSSMMKLFVILASIMAVNCQYPEHEITATLGPAAVLPVTITHRETVYKTHPLRVRTTSDVWITETTEVQSVVTSFSTIYTYVPASPRTVTSVLRITSSPVFIRTIEIMVNPTRTLVSIYTSFVTTTLTQNFWQSITHVSVLHRVETIPVWSTQTLVQEQTTTVTQFYTTEVTSTTKTYSM